jgi:diguanylate cyclase (GGDEF)-like protein
MGSRWTSRAALAAAGGGTCGLALAVLMLAGEGTYAAVAAVGAQVLGDLAAIGLASLVAWRSTGITRAAWSAIAGAFGFWLLSDSGYLAAMLAGAQTPLASAADIGWVGYVALMLTAITLIYVKLRPERDWQGVLDTLALAAALCALVWAVAIGPLSLSERLGTVAATLSLLYPASALIAVLAVGWLALRTGGGPPWLRWALTALAVGFAGEVAFLARVAGDENADHFVIAWILYAASSWLWALAAHTRLRTPSAEREDEGWSAPPVWTDAIPAAATLTAVAVLAWPQGALGAVVLTATALAAMRLIAANRANARLLAERHAESLTDPLTGALNRRALARELAVLTARSRRSGARLTALAIDLDDFKEVNDTRGHLHGDRLLTSLAAAMQGRLRAGDVLFRVGGDEFVALLPDTSADEALTVAERLRGAVGAAAAALGTSVTVSIGIAEGPAGGPEAHSLLDAADRALYRAKEGGRDRVTLASWPPPGGDRGVPIGGV